MIAFVYVYSQYSGLSQFIKAHAIYLFMMTTMVIIRPAYTLGECIRHLGIEIVSQSTTQTAQSKTAEEQRMRLVSRKDDADATYRNPKESSKTASSTKVPQKSLEEREEEYRRARAAIFQEKERQV